MSRAGPRRLDAWGVVLGLLAVGGAFNGAWMLVDPAHWYHHLPAGVPDTGPLNAHFVRDIGCAYLVLSAALAWAVLSPQWRRPLVVTAAGFHLAHALLHVHDVARGLLTTDHLLLDAWGVYAPAVVLAVAAVSVLRAPEPNPNEGVHACSPG